MNWLSLFHKSIDIPTGFDCGHCEKPKRCCDFTPFFPNFLIGAGLKNNPSLLDSIHPSRMRPLGIFPPHHQKQDCDFFESVQGRCSNWSFRPSECAGYYCSEGLNFHSMNSRQADFKIQSKNLFRLELYIAQKLLKTKGFSMCEIEDFVEEWNDFTEGVSRENHWELVLDQKKKFYVALWEDLKSESWENVLLELPAKEQRRLKKFF